MTVVTDPRRHGVARVDEASSIRPAVIAGGLQQLRLAARAGAGLENFYGRLRWKEIGRRPGALRLAQATTATRS
ncbi:hypothetical protein ACFUNF_08735 [Streptomyces sp. NPDC057291]|uniref:hypothetical protein n=1 Tax=Streptomyces sp. NPDC057291 TaxID=3346087 RepID=UPI00363195C0